MPRKSLILDLDSSLPGFAEYLASPENLFAAETPAAIFAACSHFLAERAIDPDRWQALADLVNAAVAGADESVAEAACTCLLENLATADHPLKEFLSGEALRYWEQWESAAT